MMSRTSLDCAVFIESDRFNRVDENGTTDDTNWAVQGLQTRPEVTSIKLHHDYSESIASKADITLLRRADVTRNKTRQFLRRLSDRDTNSWFVNKPDAILKYGEKTRYFSEYEDALPEFHKITSRDRDDLEQGASFAENLEDIVLKPAHLGVKSGEGVKVAQKEDINSYENLITEYANQATGDFIIQRYLPGVREHGDTRIIVAAGEPISAITRYPTGDSQIASYDRGRTQNKLSHHYVKDDEAELVEAISDRLKEDGVRWAGVDVMRDAYEDKPYVIEINGKCPSLLRKSDKHNPHGDTIGRDSLVDHLLKSYAS